MTAATQPPPGITDATFVHDVATRVATRAGEESLRATIVFVRRAGEWLAVHEHLSPVG